MKTVTHIFVYLVTASSLVGSSSWNYTPMPNMDVCEQARESFSEPRGLSSVLRPDVVRCVEVKTDKPVNP